MQNVIVTSKKIASNVQKTRITTSTSFLSFFGISSQTTNLESMVTDQYELYTIKVEEYICKCKCNFIADLLGFKKYVLWKPGNYTTATDVFVITSSNIVPIGTGASGSVSIPGTDIGINIE